MRLLDKYILKALCRSVPIWGYLLLPVFLLAQVHYLELLNILLNMGHH